MTGPPSVASTTFSAGDLAAGRFRILRFLARGGMGEVYEATDELLGIRVALKTLRAHVADDANALERFRREILFARQVTHPNVCRIFDVFHHRRTQDPGETPVTFLTMELLSGETLAERLRARGRMSPVEGLPVVAQVVSALSAAHKAGIVHRDVKSGNVMLVPSADGTDRAVVTDFGLARAVDPGEGSSTGGEMVGTSAYMAPEQVKGGTITPAADIYALGIVMYEMVTGTRPFSAESPVAIALRRLEEPPAPPSTHVPDLDPAWERTILRCLEREPLARFSAVEHVQRSLAGEAPLSDTRPMGPRQARRLGLLAVAGILLLLAAIALWRQTLPPTVPSPVASVTTQVKPRRSVAVLGFRSLSGRPESAWLGTALSEMLVTELAVGEQLRTIPGEHVMRMKRDVASAGEDSLAPETLAVIRSRLGADVVVLGSYLALGPQSGGQIRLDLRIRDTARGETLASVAETGTEDQLLDLVARSGTWLRANLGVHVGQGDRGPRADLPSNPEAARLYAEGLEKLRLFEARGARELLTRAVAADEEYPLARLALADAWSDLGFEPKARAEAQRAFESSTRLSREKRLWVEARYREITRDWQKALEIYRVLCGFFPDNLEYGVRLADVQTLSGKGKDALATLESVRKLPAPDGQHPQIDIEEAFAAQALSDFKRQRDAAQRAVSKGTRLQAPLIVAAGRLAEGASLFRLGEPGASAAFEEAQRAFAAAGDRRGEAQALLGLGSLLWQRGELAEAMKRDEQALAVFREVGNRMGVATALNNIGILLEIQGESAAARERYREALAIHRELDEKRGVALALLKLADLAAAEADFVGATRGYEEARTLSDESGNESLTAFSLGRLGEILMLQGELDAAWRREESALQIHTRIGEKDQVAKSRLRLATLALELGRPAQAEAEARLSLAEFQRQRLPDEEATAHALLAETLAVQGRSAEALKALERGSALVEHSQRPRVRLSIGLASARVLVALGRAAEARKPLGELLALTTRRRMLRQQLEARLALGMLELAAGETVPARRQLAALEREASARGFQLIARKAAAARAQHQETKVSDGCAARTPACA